MTVKIKNNRLIYLGIFVLLFICELLIARFFFRFRQVIPRRCACCYSALELRKNIRSRKNTASAALGFHLCLSH